MINKIDNGSSEHTVKQTWLCSSREELEAAIASYKRQYPTPGYGTWFTEPKPTSSGDWQVQMSRMTSCD